MKNHLRHPVRAVREPFGKAGLVVACCALLLSCTGAAFAAGRLTGSQKKEVAKILKADAKKLKGQTGPQGPPGPAGTAAAWASVLFDSSSGNATFKLQSGFSGSPTSPQVGVVCIPAPIQSAAVALTLEAPGFIQQVAPNQCGGAANYEVATQNTGGAPQNLPFTILVP